jgi:sugar/nucleoside kinase (ribokinase family)
MDIVVAGHLCIDLLPRMANIPPEALTQAGKLFEVGPMDVSTGGAVSNTGLALHRLGIDVTLLSCVGDDMIGRMIIDFLNLRDPSLTRLIQMVRGENSSYSVVLSPQQLDRIFLHHPGTNASFGVASIDFSLVEAAKIVHVGYPPILPRLYDNDGRELIGIFSRLKSHGVVTSLDMSLPDVASPAGRANWKGILETTLPYVDVFIPSFEEICFMLRKDDFISAAGAVHRLLTRDYVDELLRELIDMGVAFAGVKCGVDGIGFRSADRARVDALRSRIELDATWDNAHVIQPSFAVDVVGTTGAGDSAYAGFLAALMNGESAQESLKWACAVGACNVETADATSGIRTRVETTQRIAQGWQTNPSRLL